MLAFRNCSLPATTNGAAIDSMMCCATDSESRAVLICGSTIVNSSPPSRVTVSVSRTHCFRRSAVWRSTSSPASWPERVVDALEMVEIDDEQRELARLALRLREPARELVHEILAVRQRGQRIVVRLEVELLVLGGRRRTPRRRDRPDFARGPAPRRSASPPSRSRGRRCRRRRSARRSATRAATPRRASRPARGRASPPARDRARARPG